MEFPKDIKNYTKEECAIMLRKALNQSKNINTQTETARITGINIKTLGDYFNGRSKVPQKNWDILTKVLFVEEDIKSDDTHEKISERQSARAKHSAEKIKAIIFLLKDELEFFKNSSSEVRKILKDHLPGTEAGYLTSLLTALYDEDQLEIWKKFSK